MRTAVKAALERLIRSEDLEAAEARDLVVGLCDPDVPVAMKAGVLTALATKGETSAEIRGFAEGLRDLSRRVEVPRDRPLADTCGTGGDGKGTINVSTGTAFVVAAAGVRVAKHGNRGVSSRSGSADVLEALGVRLPGKDARVLLEKTGFTFLFAPTFHPAMAALAPVRRELGIRTVMNLVGPLVNPARPSIQLVGAPDERIAELLAGALSGLPIERAFVVTGDGHDEATPFGPFVRFDVRPGRVVREVIDPVAYGLACDRVALAGGDPADNAARLRIALGGGRASEALVLNAALVLELAGYVRPAAVAAEAIASGSALTLLDAVIAASTEEVSHV